MQSAAGIEAGGRTGLTSVVTGFLFFLCIFFAPILSSVPPWATGPVLIVVGAMMMKSVVRIPWDNYGEAVPAFVCIVIMPLTYSLSWVSRSNR
jgi:AGZA family xanthine/uracil permease-like MFS transporter